MNAYGYLNDQRPAAQPMIDDDGSHYSCSPDACGYTGSTYCQNCGYESGER